jgi:hypothetical protein
MNLKRVKTRQGTRSVLTYWYKRQHYRVRLPGVNLSSDEEKRQANTATSEIHRMVDEAALPDLTFEEFTPMYLKHIKIKRGPAVQRNESALYCHLTSWFGPLKLRAIRLEHGIIYIEHRRKEGAAEGTIERECAVLSALLNVAVDHEYLDRNRLQKMPVPQYQKRKRVANTRSQYKAPGDKNPRDELQPA